MDTVQKKRPVISLAVVFAAILIVSTFVTPLHVPAASISDLQNQYAQLQKQEQQLQDQIASQNSAVQAGQAQVASLDAQIGVTKQQLAVLQQQIDTTNGGIQAKQNEIADTQSKIDNDMDLLKKRLRALYESGHDTFLDVLFSSDSISDFLSRVEIIRAISDHDKQVISRLKQEQSQMQAEQQALQKTQQSLQQTQSTMAAKQDILNAQMAQQAQIIAQAQANVQAAQQQSAAVSAQASQTYAQITAAFAAQAAAKRAAATKAQTVVGSSGSITVGGRSLSGSVLAYQGTITQVAAQYGMSDYINLILAVMEQESDGQGNDPMQALGDASNPTPMDSIVCGIQELKQNLQLAGCTGPGDITDIEMALQGYNFGSGFISWAKGNGGYSLANAAAFSQMQASQLRWSGYGDPSYVPHVLRYYTIP